MKLPSVKTIIAVGGLVVDMGKWLVKTLREPAEKPAPLTERDVEIQLKAAQNAGKERS